jgi:hypothetical protein
MKLDKVVIPDIQKLLRSEKAYRTLCKVFRNELDDLYPAELLQEMPEQILLGLQILKTVFEQRRQVFTYDEWAEFVMLPTLPGQSVGEGHTDFLYKAIQLASLTFQGRELDRHELALAYLTFNRDYAAVRAETVFAKHNPSDETLVRKLKVTSALNDAFQVTGEADPDYIFATTTPLNNLSEIIASEHGVSDELRIRLRTASLCDVSSDFYSQMLKDRAITTHTYSGYVLAPLVMHRFVAVAGNEDEFTAKAFAGWKQIEGKDLVVVDATILQLARYNIFTSVLSKEELTRWLWNAFPDCFTLSGIFVGTLKEYYTLIYTLGCYRLECELDA